jgi:hypothetical protein
MEVISKKTKVPLATSTFSINLVKEFLNFTKREKRFVPIEALEAEYPLGDVIIILRRRIKKTGVIRRTKEKRRLKITDLSE